jgi:small subunit ribosomal protein S4
MIKKKKSYSKPKKSFESSRIKEENALATRYGLKNKREIWKTLAKIDYYRNRAKELAKSTREEQEVLFNKLKAIGLDTNTIADILDLKVENLLERRLPTIVAKKGLATTPKQARQMVVHKKILIKGRAIDSPSYIVQVSEENLITVKQKIKKPKAETVSKEEKDIDGGEKPGSEDVSEEKKETEAQKEEPKEEKE